MCMSLAGCAKDHTDLRPNKQPFVSGFLPQTEQNQSTCP